MDTTNQHAFFNECYKQYQPGVFKYIYYKTGDIDTAEDLCQETFLRFSQTMHGVHKVPLRYWVFAIAHHVVCGHYRSRKNTAYAAMTSLEDYSAINEEHLHDRTPDYDLRMILEEALQTLPPLERTVCENSLIARCPYETTADELKLTLRQVSYKNEQARRRIVSHLYKCGIKSVREIAIFLVVINIFCKLSTIIAI